ncbi:MAG TPA: ribonuclease Z [Candidatus Nanoarchaeia archaeon]|nr:ribonuclease Z [Candidatus Nanoarchaeia archaeon]
MIEITFLGTGSMVPTKQRNHSAIVLTYKTETMLMDCGEGTQRQMRIAGIKPAKITRLLISHWHGHHVFGIPGLMSTMGADKAEKKLLIYGPVGSKKYLENMFTFFTSKDVIEHEVYEVKKGKFIETEDFIVEAQPLKHSTPCIGFSFIEKDRRRIDVAKAKKHGLMEGPLLGKIQQGGDVIINGKKVKADEVSYIVPGKKVSYIADTVPCEGADALARNANLLISEGTHLDDIKEKTEKFMHLTVKQAAMIASENNAQKLVITHLSQRYKSPTETLEEAKTYFPNSIVAEDFMKVQV